MSDHVLILMDSRVTASPLGLAVRYSLREAFPSPPPSGLCKTQLCSDVRLDEKAIEFHKKSACDGQHSRHKWRIISGEEWDGAVEEYVRNGTVPCSATRKEILVVNVADERASNEMKDRLLYSPILIDIEVRGRGRPICFVSTWFRA
jgi:hypothetical protein